jgi:diadenylate cyclase
MSELLTPQNFIRLIDILVVWFALYYALKAMRGTRAVQLIRGIAVLIIVRLVAWWLGLPTVSWILDQVINWAPIALVVIFQQEIRRFLENLGNGSFNIRRKRDAQTRDQKLVSDLSGAIEYLAARKIGALIALEQRDSLQDYINTGIALDADVSSGLLINTFIPNTPLHDGAVIIRNFRIASAASYLPLSDNRTIAKELGTRHRSAVGLSENTDALVIVVSEETGEVSVAQNGYLSRHLEKNGGYQEFLANQLVANEEDQKTILDRIRQNTRTRSKPADKPKDKV